MELAREVAAAEGAGITVHVRDLLDEAAHADLGLFDVVLDKGTYDAVTLNPDSSVRRAAPRTHVLGPAAHLPPSPCLQTAADPSGAYIASVARMVKEGGCVSRAALAHRQSRGASPPSSPPLHPLALARAASL